MQKSKKVEPEDSQKTESTVKTKTALNESEIIEAFQREDNKIVQWMLEHPQEMIKERKAFLEQLLKKRCSYGSQGGILPVALAPLFLKHESMELVISVAEQLDKILDKVILKYFEDDYVRSYIPYPEIPQEWIEWNPGYAKPSVLSRHDALFDGKTLKYIEFNTENPGGRGWLDTYEELFRNYPVYRDFIRDFASPKMHPLMHSIRESLLACYKEWGGVSEKPRVALVSFKKYLLGSDDEIIRDYLIETGLETNFVDAREFEYRDGRLHSGNIPIELINLTLRFNFFKRFPREMSDFLRALKDNAACYVNPFRAAIGAHKETLSFMTNEENHHYFTKEEAECIRKYIPWTRKMDETITISKEGTDIALQEYAIKHKDELVLKPTASAGGYEVHVGKVTDRDKWNSVIENSIGCPWWIIQEACEIPEYEFPVLKGNKVVLEKKNLNLSPYIFNGKYAGCLGRISESKVINVSAGGGLIPVFTLKRKEESRSV